MVTRELELFELSLRKTNQILKVVGLQTNEDTSQSMMERLKNRKLFLFLFCSFYFEVIGVVAWFIDNGLLKGDFIEATYSLPCATLCFMGTIKSIYRLKYEDHISDLICILRRLQTAESGIHADPIAFKTILTIVGSLDIAVKVLLMFNVSVLVAFSCSPLLIMLYTYCATGELDELRFPFPIWYPFDPTDLRVYPFLYLHQIFAGIVAVFIVFGPDCLYYLFCTFVQVQFSSLYYDFEKIIPPNSKLRVKEAKEAYQKKFIDYVARHRELIRCAALIETIYSKSALFNFGSSSLLICLAGFNIVSYEDFSMLYNFLTFLIMCLLQIYQMCYFGDNLSRSSAELGYALYKSEWYTVDAKVAKDLLMILMRTRKPCKLTAYLFSEINLNAFTRILSTSWSYFALLQSMYKR